MILIRILDVETTGLDPALHRVCEVGTVDLILHPPGSIVGSCWVDKDAKIPTVERGPMWSSLINPGMPIPPEASAVHDITDDMVAGKPAIGEVMDVIRSAPADSGKVVPDYYCAHNSRFDSKFIDQQSWKWLDTYRIALWLWPSCPSHSNACLRYWLKLNLAIKDQMMVDGHPGCDHGSAWIRSHRALWDAYVTAAVLRRALMWGATVHQMMDVSCHPALLPRFRFGQHEGKPIEEVPTSYLDWILKNFEREKEDERHTAFFELQRRQNHGQMG